MNSPKIDGSSRTRSIKSPRPHRKISGQHPPSLNKYGALLKDPKKMGMMAILLLVLIMVPLAFADTYIIKDGDNLTKIANIYGTTVEEIAAANNIANPNIIFIGQQIEIPNGSKQDSSISTQSAPADIPNTPATTELNPTVSSDYSCTRFNFLQGRDGEHGSAAGVYVMNEVTNGPLVSWHANEGDKDSGWINGFPISYEFVHVKVWFYADGGNGLPTEMEIVNPATGTSTGWLTRGTCHAIEIQYSSTSSYRAPADAPYTPATTELNPTVSGTYSCTRFNFLVGRDSERGSSAGVYVMNEVTNGSLVSWHANEGDKDSGWINGFPISYESVHVTVWFYADGGDGTPIEMEIVNPVPNTSTGWLTRGTCHAIEIQYPAGR
ncbi:MAG: LysM peptidoglycan-binding domain-containing protein [Chloroflexi bacterium]|nr:LysM peptidoglycan-binding domain-containing protein [Chloroflexota bacterium]